MQERIKEIIADFLDTDVAELPNNRTLEDLKIDSLDFLEMTFEVEEEFDTPLTSEIQERRAEMHDLGDVLRIAEEMILAYRAEEAAKSNS